MARSFNGTSAYLSVTDNDAITCPNGDWSIAGWIKPAALPLGSPEFFYCAGNYGVPSFLSIHIGTASNTITVLAFSDDFAFKYLNHADAEVTEGTWHHILVRNDGDDFQLYTDGVQRANNNTAWGSINPYLPLLFGNNSQLLEQSFFNGDLAEWAKWDSALTVPQIAQLVDGESPLAVGSPAWYIPMQGDDYAGKVVPLSVTNSGTTDSAHPPQMYAPRRRKLMQLVG